MNSFLRNPFSRRKESPVQGVTLGYYGTRPVYSTTNIDAIAREAYQGNPDVYTAVETLAQATASIDWYGEVKVRGVWERTESHPGLDLWERPNPLRPSSTALVGDLVRWRCIAGEWFLARNEKPSGPPKELWVLKPGRMYLEPGAGIGMIAGYKYKIGGKEQALAPTDVLHVPMFNPIDDWRGQSPLMAAAKLVDQADAAGDYNLGLLQNGGIPPLFLTTGEELGDVEFEAFKKEMHTGWMANKNAGLPQLLEGGMDVKTVGVAPKDMQMLEAQRMFALKFAQVIRVPAEFLSGADEKKYANYGEALKALHTEGSIPIAMEIRDSVNAWFAQWFPDFRLQPDIEGIEALSENEDAKWSRIAQATHLTINEKRRETNQEGDVDGGDVVLVPFSLTPLGEVGQPVDAAADDGGEVEGKSKALNVPDAAKAAYWKLVDGKRVRLESSVEAVFAKQLKADNAEIVAAISGAPTEPAAIARMEKAVDASNGEWAKLIESVWLKVGKPFADDTLEELKTIHGPERVKAGDAWVSRVVGYLSKHGAAKVKDIAESTKRSLSEEMQKGIAAGESIPALAARVDAYQLESLIPKRATAIARTEIVGASNAASVAAAESTGLPLEKDWIPTADDRTRESHQQVDPVGLDEAFTLGDGDTVMFPADSSLGADASNIVQCRCAVAFRVAD